jgi:hypothetical protein
VSPRPGEANLRLLGSPTIRPVLLGMWLPNGLIVGAEAMYIPYAGAAASALFIAAALGMLCGDLVVGRWVPGSWRVRLPNRLHLLLAAPHLLFLVHPPVWLAVAAVAVACSSGWSPKPARSCAARRWAWTPTAG